MERTYLHKGTYCNFPVFAWLDDTLFGQKARTRSAMSWFMPHILKRQPILGVGNSNMFFYFHPKTWEDFPILTVAYFADGWENNHQPENLCHGNPAPDTWWCYHGWQRNPEKAELGEADSTFIFAARLRSTSALAGGTSPWPPARQKEAVKNTMQDAVVVFFCVCVCGMLVKDDETWKHVVTFIYTLYLKDV